VDIVPELSPQWGELSTRESKVQEPATDEVTVKRQVLTCGRR
jgi:hypothetical protein